MQSYKQSTKTLLKKLSTMSSFGDFNTHYVDELQTTRLCDYITELCTLLGEPHERVINRAGLDRVYGHQIFCGMRNPKRDKVIQLAFGFQMNASQCDNMLKVARKPSLYPRIQRDAVIIFCLEHKVDFLNTQIMLRDQNLPALGDDTAHD